MLRRVEFALKLLLRCGLQKKVVLICKRIQLSVVLTVERESLQHRRWEDRRSQDRAVAKLCSLGFNLENWMLPWGLW